MDLQPEDVRVPSGDSSPTQVPPEEWACRRSDHTRYWFYRAWFHHKTLPWDHEDIEYYKSATGYFIDDHPASQWPSIYSRVWGTRGWQLVLSATQSLSIWTQCEEYEAALRVEEERIAAAQQLSHTPPSRRGQKRQAVDNLEYLSVQYQVEALLQNFSQLDVSKVFILQGLPVPQQEQLISGDTLNTYRDELHQVYQPDDPLLHPGRSTAASSTPPGQTAASDPVSEGTGLPLPLPDSGSMSLNSTSTESQHTMEPPFPTDRPRD